MSATKIITNIQKLGFIVENKEEFIKLIDTHNLDLTLINTLLSNTEETQIESYLQLLNNFLIPQNIKINIENKRISLIKL